MEIVYNNQLENAETPAGEIMSSAKMAIKESPDNTLLNEALFLYDQGVRVYLSNWKTNKAMHPYSEFEPITDRDVLKEMCTENSSSNLNVAVDWKFGLVALAHGVGNEKEFAEESFRELYKQYGKLNTLGYLMPSGESYFLFKCDQDCFDVKGKPGLKLLKSVESLPVYPSVIDGKPVQKIGTSATIRELSSWLGQSAVIDKTESTSTIPDDMEQVESDPAVDVSLSLKKIVPDDEACKQPDSEPSAPEGQVNMEKDQVPQTKKVEDRIIDWLKEKRETADIIAELFAENKPIEKPLTELQITRLVVTVAAEHIKDEDGEPLEGDTALLLEVADLELKTFKDEHGKGHGFIKSSGTNILITHSDLPKFLVYKFRQIFGRLPKPARVKEAIQILEMIAEYDSKQITLHNRVAKHDGAFYYDMGDTRSIRTTAEGWEIVKSPILFRRHSHQLPQVDPIRGGNVWKIFDFLNIKKNDQLLLLVYIISLFIPGIPHPVFHPWGDYGSAKSFLCAVINLFCDPTSVTKTILNKKEADAIQNFYKHYVAVLDNLSDVPEWLSDLICQACTGSSFNKRKLYTDSDDIIFTIKHCVILNGLEMLIIKPDLMQRTITMHIEKPEVVREEDDVWNAFQAARAEILGGILDILVKAIGTYPTLKLDNLPRMADFYRWGYAIADAMDKKGEQFVKDYQANIVRQHEGVMHHNSLCSAVFELMSGREKYDSTVAKALSDLKQIASPANNDPSFPSDAKNLGRSLGLIKQTLAGFGISYEIGKRQGKGTPIIIKKVINSGSLSSPATPEVQKTPEIKTVTHPSIPPKAVKSEAGEVNEAQLQIFDFGSEASYV